MASANGTGDPTPAEENDPERTQRMPALQEVVDRWFGDDPESGTQGGGAR